MVRYVVRVGKRHMAKLRDQRFQVGPGGRLITMLETCIRIRLNFLLFVSIPMNIALDVRL